MAILEDIKKTLKNLDIVFFKYSKYSYILIGSLIIINYSPKIMGLVSTIIAGSIGKLLGRSSKIAPDMTSKIAAEVERLSKQLNENTPDTSKIAAEVERLAKQLTKNTPTKIVKDLEKAAMMTSKLTKNTPQNVVNKVALLVDDLEIDLEESEDLKSEPKPGRPSEAWKRVQKMVKDKKFKKMIKDDKKRKSIIEEVLDESEWATEQLEQDGGAPSYRNYSDFLLLFIILSSIHYLDYSDMCSDITNDKIFISGLWTVLIVIFIYFSITKLGLLNKIHLVLKQRGYGLLAELIDGIVIFLLYNIVRNVRNITGANKCPIKGITGDNKVIQIETYISNIQEDINLLMKQIENEKTKRDELQIELEDQIAKKDKITEDYRLKIDEQLSNSNQQYAELSGDVDQLEKQLEDETASINNRINDLEISISDLIISQAKSQTLIDGRIRDIEEAQENFKNLILGRLDINDEKISSLEKKLSDYVSKAELEGVTASVSDLQNSVIALSDRITLLEKEKENTNIKINNNAASIDENKILITSLTKKLKDLENNTSSSISDNTILINQIEETIKNLSQKSSSNEDSINVNTNLIVSLQDALTEMETSLARTSSTSIANSSLISSLQNALSSLEISVQANTILIKNLDTEFQSLRLRVDKIEKLLEELKEIKSRLGILEVSKDGIIAEIEADNIKQADFERRISDLEEELKKDKDKKDKDNKGKALGKDKK